MDRGAWRATVHGVTKSRTRLHIHSDYKHITDQPVLARRGDRAGRTSPATSAKVLSTQRKEERMQDVIGKPEVPPPLILTPDRKESHIHCLQLLMLASSID